MANILSDLEVPKEVHSERINICSNCPLLMGSKDKMETARCGDCGCFVYIKGGLKDFTCPQGKW